MTIRVKEKIKKSILILHSIIILTSALILLYSVRYCKVCGGRYIGFNKENMCDACIDHKEARINGKYLKII